MLTRLSFLLSLSRGFTVRRCDFPNQITRMKKHLKELVKSNIIEQNLHGSLGEQQSMMERLRQFL